MLFADDIVLSRQNHRELERCFLSSKYVSCRANNTEQKSAKFKIDSKFKKAAKTIANNKIVF